MINELGGQAAQIANFQKIVNDSKWAECEGGNVVYTQKTLFKKISALVSPTGNQELFPIEVHICDKCGKVPKFIAERLPELPEDLISKCDSNNKGSLILS